MIRELDERVAVEVMGWERNHTFMGFWGSKDRPIAEPHKHWRPTQDIAQAFQVVERMRADGCRIDISNIPPNVSHDVIEGGWECSIWKKRPHLVVNRGQHQSLPTAICQAALAAKGAK